VDLSRTTRVSWHQKGKTILDLLKQEIVSGSGISWAICISAPHPRHKHTSTQHCFLQTGCPSCCPTNSVKVLKEWNDPYNWLIYRRWLTDYNIFVIDQNMLLIWQPCCLPVYLMLLSPKNDVLWSYGYCTTLVWETPCWNWNPSSAV